MKITCLLENTTTKNDILTEHGLSLYIETEKHNILFDMGQSDLFAKNAETLGIDLSKVDIAIISHGHYDHGGGLETFLRINNHAPIYINKNAFGSHYSGTEKYIGLDIRLKDNSRIRFTEDETVIDDNINLLTCNNYTSNNPLSNEKMNIKTENGFVSDKFKHEQYLVITENGTKTVISGCSHKGILNITEWFDPDILVGGFHFKNTEMSSDGINKLKNVAQDLLKTNSVFYTCHCTGIEQFNCMKEIMQDRLFYLSCGNNLNI